MSTAEQPGIALLVKRANNSFAAVALIVAYLAIALLPLLIVGLAHPRTDHTFLQALGRAFALVGLVLVALQFILASRIRGIARHYGQDMLLRFHKGMGVLAVLLIFFHPILLVVENGNWGLIFGSNPSWPIGTGRFALVLLIVLGVTSVFSLRRIEYESWRLIHNVAIIVFLLGFVHSWVIGDDIEFLPMRILWAGLLGAVLVSYGYHKFYRPFTGRRKPYRVEEVTQETRNVWTLTFAPPEGEKPYVYLPGQFHYLTLYRGDARYDGEEHHFTISSSPARPGALTSTIKELGDFTRTIGNTTPGDQARLQGPFGRFTPLLRPELTDLVFIAGGIGITPLMSNLRYLYDTAADVSVVLLYANRAEDDIVFRQELDEIAGSGRLSLRVVHVLENAAEGWAGEQGFVTADIIRKYCGEDVTGKAFYVCGPPAMMRAVVKALGGLRVPPSNIYMEEFSI